jgi:fido (protein-threonine AMPylation protein)
MFVVSEVHPYSDGNGRVARAVMNATLVGAGHRRVIIPPGYREDYLRALKALSHQTATAPFIRMLDRAQRYVSELPMEDYAATVSVLEATGALDETGDRRLRMPGEVFPVRDGALPITPEMVEEALEDS